MIRLRPTTDADLDMVLAAERHPDNYAFVGQWSRERHQQAIADPNAAHRIVERAEDGQAVGFIIICGLTSLHQSIEFRRIVITEKRRGYGRAALRLARVLVFEHYDAHRMWLEMVDTNHWAQALYESEGFVVEGRLRECLKSGDQFVSLVVLSMLRPEYERLKQRDS
jgi:RimJ/RimL family protein N-acetyltransferase